MLKIKIAQVITRLDWGGSPDIVRILSSRLDAQVFEVRLIFGPSKHLSSKTKDFLNKLGQRPIFIPHLIRDPNIIYDCLALIELYFVFRRERFDIVHTHTAKAGALGRIAAYLAKTKVIVHTPHGHNFYGYFGRLLSECVILIEKFLANFSDKIIALTELEKKGYLRLFNPAKIELIYQGLELDQYSGAQSDARIIKDEFNIQADEKIVGMVARLEPVKGAQYLIEAAGQILKSQSKVRFIVVGEGSLRQRLQQRVAELGLRERFIFTGWREDASKIMSVFKILVLPSLNEAVGMVLIEAQSQGIPAIASNVGGIPEVIKDKETGVLIPSADALSLAKAVIDLLSDQDKLGKMGSAAKVWMNARFKAENMVEKTVALYQKLLEVKS